MDQPLPDKPAAFRHITVEFSRVSRATVVLRVPSELDDYTAERVARRNPMIQDAIQYGDALVTTETYPTVDDAAFTLDSRRNVTPSFALSPPNEPGPEALWPYAGEKWASDGKGLFGRGALPAGGVKWETAHRFDNDGVRGFIDDTIAACTTPLTETGRAAGDYPFRVYAGAAKPVALGERYVGALDDCILFAHPFVEFHPVVARRDGVVVALLAVSTLTPDQWALAVPAGGAS